MKSANTVFSQLMLNNTVRDMKKALPDFRSRKHVSVIHHYRDMYTVEIVYNKEPRWETYLYASNRNDARQQGIEAWARFKGLELPE